MGGKWNNFYLVAVGIQQHSALFIYDDMRCANKNIFMYHPKTDTRHCSSPQPPRMSSIQKPNIQFYRIEIRAAKKMLCLSGKHKQKQQQHEKRQQQQKQQLYQHSGTT